MKSGQKSRGFTIVETLIFLAVSSALLASSLALIGGSQDKTQFKQGINDAQQQIDQVISNVSNGYYPKVGNFKCVVDNDTELNITIGSVSDRGANEQCVFLGRVMQFEENSSDFKVYSIAGTRYEFNTVYTAKNVKTMDKAIPTIVKGSNIENLEFKHGIELKTIKTDTNGTITTDRGAVGFFSSFGISATSGDVESSAQQVEFASIVGSSLVTDILENALKDGSGGSFRNTYENTEKNPSGGIEICFDSGTTDQHGIITIGGVSRTASTSLQIKNGTCPP